MCVRTPQWAGIEDKLMQMQKLCGQLCANHCIITHWRCSSLPVRLHYPECSSQHILFAFYWKEVKLCVEKLPYSHVYFSSAISESTFMELIKAEWVDSIRNSKGLPNPAIFFYSLESLSRKMMKCLWSLKWKCIQRTWIDHFIRRNEDPRQHSGRSSPLLTTGRMQMEAMMRYHCTLSEWIKSNDKQANKNPAMPGAQANWNCHMCLEGVQNAMDSGKLMISL